MGFLDRVAAKQATVLGGRAVAKKSFTQPPFWSLPDWAGFGGGWSTPDREKIENDYLGYVRGAYKSNGIVYSCIAARQRIFSQVRFGWREFKNFRPGDLFGNQELSLLEKPWPGATTIDLLTRVEVVASCAGNYYATKCDDNGKIGKAATGPGQRIVNLRPDWVTIVIVSPSDDLWDPRAKIGGYLYEPMGNFGPGGTPSVNSWILMPDEMCHFMPHPDPEARFRGMSWLTPILREIQADKAATKHKEHFFKNGAQLGVIVKFDKDTGVDAMKAFIERFNASHQGEDNSYKTLFLGGGADVTITTADMKQIDFKNLSGGGEPLALDTPIPTPSGWTTMGDIQVGDQILGRNGLPARVTGVAPIHVGRQCYRVTFGDKSSIVADASHIWTAMDRNFSARPGDGRSSIRVEREYTTQQLFEKMGEWEARGERGNRFNVAPAAPTKLPALDLLIDPYVLGAWLGDGQTAGPAICGADEDLAFIASEVERRGYTIRYRKPQPGKVATFSVPGGLMAALDAEGILGAKRIPDEYLRGSIEQRLDLLRGLMDTDGSVDSKGRERCEFSSKWEALARQVLELIRSLGYRATIGRKVDARSRTGEHWRVQFRANPDLNPFLLPRKASKVRTQPHVLTKPILSIEPVESVPVRCIAVDTEDHLFLAGDGWTPTHNTRVASAAGIHPTIAGFSEGLQGSSLNAGNFGAARRLVADTTMRHLWGVASSSFQPLLAPPSERASLWYETRDVAFLREDVKDIAEIQAKEAQTIRSLSDAGYKHDSIIKALVNEDWTLLEHSGLYSVQLIPPGQAGAPPNPAAEQPAIEQAPAASNGNSGKPLETIPAKALAALPAGEG